MAPKPKRTPGKKKHFFMRFSEACSDAAGRPYAFILAFLLILVWAATGPVFGYSEVWQIVINTATTIITFLLVFLIQSTQNRETRALQLKLDELIYASAKARNETMDLENLSEDELKERCKQYETLAEAARRKLHKK